MIASKIAAEAADVAKGLDSAWEREREMGKARKEFDWEKQFELAFDHSKPRSYRNKCELDDDDEDDSNLFLQILPPPSFLLHFSTLLPFPTFRCFIFP